jgi:hypothetical protein
MVINILRDMKVCSVVDRYKRFGENFCLHFRDRRIVTYFLTLAMVLHVHVFGTISKIIVSLHLIK